MRALNGSDAKSIMGLWAIATALLVVAVGISQAQPLPADQGADAPAQTRAARPAGDGPSYIPGEIIVKLRNGSSAGRKTFHSGAATQRLEATLCRLEAEYRVNRRASTGALATQSRRRARLQRHVLETDEDVAATCAALRDDPEVENAQPNYIYRTCRVPNDPDFPDQYAHQLIQMPDAWDISTGSHDVVVAVLGTGIDVNHPDLKDNIWTNEGEIPGNDIDDDENGYIDDVQGWNFESNDNEVIPEPDFWGIAGHETMVAGVIAAVGDNGEGVCGVNWQCSLMPLRVSLFFTSLEVVEGIDYAAANGADILNMSFGADAEAFGSEGDPLLKEAIDNAYAQGVLLVASAGNDDTDEIYYPAGYPNVLAVASTDGEDLKTGHSTYGPWVDIAAPGTDIVTTDLEGEYIATAGTSFSAPYVAAVGALVLSHRPDLSHVELRAILENTTDPVYYGLVNPDVCYVGTGRVNAYTALLDADVRFPLGEIAAPSQGKTFAADVNAVDLTLLIHGDAYQLEYSRYGSEDWALVEGAPIEPDGLVQLSFPSPGVGTYDLRLTVSRDGNSHIDRKVFGIELGTSQDGWPKPAEAKEVPDEGFYGSPICMDVDGDGRNEIIQSSISWESLWGIVQLNVWQADGTPLPGWPQALEFAYDPPICAVGDIDGDGDYEIVGACNYDALVYAWHAENGEPVDGDWPVILGDWFGSIAGSPVLADLDGDGDSEIIVALDAVSGETDGLYAIQADGSSLWQRRYAAEGALSVADFDQDGDVEIALCGYGPGISNIYTYILDHQGQLVKKWHGGSSRGTAIGDLDGDDQLELVFCTEDEVQAVRVSGSTAWKTRINDPFDTIGTLSLGDVDGNGNSEVYVTSYLEEDGFTFTLIHGLDHTGRLLTDLGFPKTVMGYPGNSAPLIGDVDGNGEKDLIVGAAGTPIMAWQPDGSSTPGFPMLDLWTEINCGPALNDLDQDGDIELIVGGWDYRFHVMDLPGEYSPANVDWGLLRHDPQNSGWTSLAPTLDPIVAPDQVRPGEKLEFTLHASNPEGRPLRFLVGNLPEGASFDEETLIVSWKPAAEQSLHSYRFSFLVTDGIRQTSRSVSIAVVLDAIYQTNMDTDPGWQLDDGWAWGTPSGGGSWNGDPASGHTGQAVVGYALDGDYDHDLPETRYATTGPIDCEGYENIRLSFWRWLGVEAPYDYANVQVSNDGETWVDLWTTGYAHISEQTWQFVEYAVPASIADGQTTVYFRWGIGPTDESVAYPGWNIDDVQVTGDHIE